MLAARFCYCRQTTQCAVSQNLAKLLQNSVGTTCTGSPEQIEVMELEGYSLPMYNKLVHSATIRSTVVGVIHKLTVDEFVNHTNTDDLLWQNFLS